MTRRRSKLKADLGIPEGAKPLPERIDISRMDDTARQPADARRLVTLLRLGAERHSQEAA